MSEGVHVYGAASMGALRAAELAAFGMRGIGKVFDAYRSGAYPPFTDCPFEDDDEVAVIQGPDFTGYRPLSDAMVDIREGLARAAEAAILTAANRDYGVTFAKGLYYPDRTMGAVVAAIGERDRVEGVRFGEWWTVNGVSQKAEDVRLALRTIAG